MKIIVSMFAVAGYLLISLNAGGQNLLKKIKDQVNQEINRNKPPQKRDTFARTATVQPAANNALAPSQNITYNNAGAASSDAYRLPEQIHFAPGILDDSLEMNIPIVWNNSIFFISPSKEKYGKNTKWQLVQYDSMGTKFNLLNNIVPGLTIQGLQDTMVISNNKLYIPLFGILTTKETLVKRATARYERVLLEYDGNTVTQVPVAEGYDIDKPFSLNGQLYFLYYNRGAGNSKPVAEGQGRLATYSNQAIKLMPYDSAAGNIFRMPDDVVAEDNYPVLYRNKMYFAFAYQFSIWAFDGKYMGHVKNVIRLTSMNMVAPVDFPLVYNDNLYFRYMNGVLGEFNGKTFRVMDDFKIDDRAVTTPYFVYKNKLYITGKDSLGLFQLSSFDGNQVIHLSDFDPSVSREVKGDTYDDPIVYDNYVWFKVASGSRASLRFDGTAITYKPAGDNAPASKFPILFKNKLYGAVPGHGAGYDIDELNIDGPFIEENTFHRHFKNAHSIELKDRLYFFYQTGYDKSRLVYVDQIK